LWVQANYQLSDGNSTFQDQYNFQMNMLQNGHNFVDIQFQYQAQNGTNQTQLKIQFRVARIIEYNTTDDITPYTNQSVVSSYPEER